MINIQLNRIPEGSATSRMLTHHCLPDGTTVERLLEDLDIRKHPNLVVIVNGKRAELHQCLKNNDLIYLLIFCGGG